MLACYLAEVCRLSSRRGHDSSSPEQVSVASCRFIVSLGGGKLVVIVYRQTVHTLVGREGTSALAAGQLLLARTDN